MRSAREDRTVPPEGRPATRPPPDEHDIRERRYPSTGRRLWRRVLIVDPDPATRELYAWRMRVDHWKVQEASSGEEAIVVAVAWSPDVVVMDFGSPTVSGFETACQLKRNAGTSHIPIVASGDASSDVDGARARAMHAGCVEFIGKPCAPEALRDLLAEIVARSGETCA